MQEKDFTYLSPWYFSTQRANSLWGMNSITWEKIVRHWFMGHLRRRSIALMGIQIVPNQKSQFAL